MSTTPKKISDLIEGDCFFYSTPDDRARLKARLATMDELRELLGEVPLDAYEFDITAQSGHVVVAVVRATGERCVQRLSDNTYWIWYEADTVVQYSANRDAFLLRQDEIRKQRKKMDDEQSRMNAAKSKKARQAEAVAA